MKILILLIALLLPIPCQAGTLTVDGIVSSSSLRLTALSSEPTEVVGQVYLATGSDGWDPAGTGETTNYYVLCTATDTYVPLLSFSGGWYAASVGMPTLEGDELDDTTSPHALIEAEIRNKKLTNAGAGAAKTYTMPEHTTQDDWNVMFMCEDAQNVKIDAHANDAYTLNGLAAAAGEDIVNEACVAGASIILYSTEVGVFLESKFAAWEEDTPP